MCASLCGGVVFSERHAAEDNGLFNEGPSRARQVAASRAATRTSLRVATQAGAGRAAPGLMEGPAFYWEPVWRLYGLRKQREGRLALGSGGPARRPWRLCRDV